MGSGRRFVTGQVGPRGALQARLAWSECQEPLVPSSFQGKKGEREVRSGDTLTEFCLWYWREGTTMLAIEQ